MLSRWKIFGVAFGYSADREQPGLVACSVDEALLACSRPWRTELTGWQMGLPPQVVLFSNKLLSEALRELKAPLRAF